MKPMLDRMIDMVVQSLSGEARRFYDREFGFFNEVTSISGKLKPFIRRTKAEKKVCHTDKIVDMHQLLYRRKLTRRWPKSSLK
jgi:hypothetical protein